MSAVAAGDTGDLQDSAVIGFVDGPARIVASGCYRCVCVELDLFHLAVNSVLNYTAISDMEGSDAMADVIESSTTIDATAGSSRDDVRYGKLSLGSRDYCGVVFV
jgi:hypothetical protein